MQLQRRQLLRSTGTGLLLTAMPWLATATSTSQLHRHAMSDDEALPRFRSGELVVVDSACNGFDGAGLYLYPAWGKPRPYLVTDKPGGMLAFSNPGTGKLLWVQSHAMDHVFAGKIVEPRVMGAPVTSLTPLQLPVLPSISSVARI